MTTGKNNKILASFAIIFFAFSFLTVYAQSNSKVANDLVIKLQQKVLLNQKQADDIKQSLNNYFADPSEENRTALENKIESLLESKQKMKYSIIKADWWDNVSKEVNRIKKTN